MILTIIIIVFVLAIAFFHYTQGFFSATLSALIAIISALLAFSYHESVVEALLGGRFSSTAHGMVLAVMFGGIYMILRLAFDSMVPGNVRFPVLVDKIGGAAMGLVAGVFAGGIMAIVAQYLPLMPSVGGYARYAVADSRSVVVPPEATGRSATDSEVWDALKSEAPGRLDPQDKQAMLLPMDDILVNTVSRLSDGGSLAGSRPLDSVHPNFLGELFAQRLGIQTGASRVATQAALGPVEVYRVDSLDRRDHEYKEIRQRPLETGPLKPKANEVLLVARVMFTRQASDKDGLVRISPGSVRLVAQDGSGANAEMVNYHPIGTVDNARVLYVSAVDDFLFVDARGADRGVDLAFLVDKSAFEGTQGPTLRFLPGSFLEVKRMARAELDEVKPPSAYKPSENIKVMRKKRSAQDQAQVQAQVQPQAQAGAGTAPAGGAAPADALKARLVGNWAGSSDTGQLIIEFKPDGTLTFNNTPRGGLPTIGQGTWAVVPEKTTADTLVITRTVNNQTAENTIQFSDDNNMTLTSAGRPPLQLQRR